MAIKIDDMTPAASVAGTELIPACKAGATRSLTPGQVKDYTIDQIEAIAAGTAVSGADGVYVLQGGDLKPVNIDLVTQRAIDIVWGKDAEATPVDAGSVPLKQGGAEKTMTLTVLAGYVRDAIRAAILNVNDAAVSTAGAFSDADVLLIAQGSVGKKVTWANVRAAMQASLAAYIAGLTGLTSLALTDEVLIVSGGVSRKVDVETLKDSVGLNVAVPPSVTTANKIPQWGAVNKTLNDGLTLRTVVRGEGVADDVSVPTENAVRELLGGQADEGVRQIIVDVTVSLGATGGVSLATIPSGVILRSVQANVVEGAAAGGTSVKIGLGVDADPDRYGLSGALTLNTKIDSHMANYEIIADPTWTARGDAVIFTPAAISLKAFPCATDGALGDTGFSAGGVRVRVAYEHINSLDDV